MRPNKDLRGLFFVPVGNITCLLLWLPSNSNDYATMLDTARAVSTHCWLVKGLIFFVVVFESARPKSSRFAKLLPYFSSMPA